MTADIIERLDIRRRQETEITELELLLLDAADEIEKLRAKLAQPQAPHDDPVAWLIEWLNDGTKSVSLSESINPSPHKSTPLYTYPSPDRPASDQGAVREALKSARSEFERQLHKCRSDGDADYFEKELTKINEALASILPERSTPAIGTPDNE